MRSILSWVAPVKSLLDANVKTVLELDDNEVFKVGTVFHHLDVIVNREVEGKVYNGRERIDRVRALKMATIWAAEYVQRQDRLGSLERGKLARPVGSEQRLLDRPGTRDQEYQAPAYGRWRQDRLPGKGLLAIPRCRLCQAGVGGETR